jgi:BirA family biotin operon repressor/biotin-[acetyl-CoA-carboxylase] ligase
MPQMKHIHLDSIDSTTGYLQKHFPKLPTATVISCNFQSAGRGQYDRKWDCHDGTLCFSFTFEPTKNLSLLSLEVPILITNFFNQGSEVNLSVKWPNDLLRDKKKCAGFIIHNKGEHNYIVGVGINLTPVPLELDYRTPASSIYDSKNSIDKEKIVAELYRYMLDNRVPENKIISEWNKVCAHLGEEIELLENTILTQGKFMGVGENGQALIEIESELKEFYSGSIIFKN